MRQTAGIIAAEHAYWFASPSMWNNMEQKGESHHGKR